ncbi:putative RNA-binding protein (RRM superfamily) protein [Dioscorea alata]|uniref:RNA-binding protein (RRM superfamily) protein n=1 Tax=Dioscorea alata TaxID=55571 RepID=A0ACB7W7Q8_DIOAL|nr:putative RNA-binding protein (RRM superfamily) protein [Dioscorea alata]
MRYMHFMFVLHCVMELEFCCNLQVFSAYGYVHKIATFEKGACFQALIQFSNSDIASEVKTALNGRCIPRDYTNPHLPVKGHSVIEGTSQSAVGPYGNKRVPESNVLLAFIKDMEYAVTIDVIHTVFSAYGTVLKIVMFEKNNGMHALVQYPDVITAATAKMYLEGHCIYDGGYCKLHLSYSRHTNLTVMGDSDKSRDYTIPETRVVAAPPAFTGWQPSAPAAPVSAAVQMPSYDPSRLIIPASSSTYPGQSLMPHSGPAYPATGAYSSTSAASLHASRLISLYGMHPGASGPSGSSSSQPHGYYQ